MDRQQYLAQNKYRQEIIKTRSEAKLVVLEPIGFPLESSFIESPEIEITNKELFEIYARDQWSGYKVYKNQYIFDQKLIPDYAFKIIDVRPDTGYITNNTSFLVVINKNKPVNTVKSSYRISDVVGQEKAKNKTRIITKYLEVPEKFNGWAPKNILFYGMPGTGKTMLAQALANEVNVPIHMIKATSLIGDHVGDGAKQIHELYEEARNNKPTIIFIDEIDAIALERRYQSLRGDVTEIVNALLTEMDGIEDNEDIITICATNNPALECTFNIESVVEKTKNFSGRDIKEKILKTALHQAITDSSDFITEEYIDNAIKETKKPLINQDTMFV